MILHRFHVVVLGGWAAILLAGCRLPQSYGRSVRAHTGRRVALPAPAHVIWRKQLIKYVYAPLHPDEFAGVETSPDHKRLWVGSRSKFLWALQLGNSWPLWKRKMPGEILSRPLYVPARKLLYLGLGDGCLYALDPHTGVRRWRYCTKGVIYRRPVYSRGLVYFANNRNRVFALDARTGEWRWSYDREIPEGFTVQGHAGVLVQGHRLYTGFSDGVFVCLDARTGDPLWTRDLSEGAREYADVDATPRLVDGVVYASSYSGGLYALSPQMGSLQWRFSVKGASSVAVADGRIYFVSALRGLHCLDLEGHLRYRQVLDAGTPGTPLVYRDLLVFATSEKGVLFVSRRTGRAMGRMDLGYGVSAPITLDGRHLFFLENGGWLVRAQMY
ncbi:MAG: PQQ-binding-like beta-propeller repeat protein [Deltaproteobacteria bacterium]|nr:PQQ-binding-like beta-propeller repeat protein [Deltaproteobacteria bacterium]